MLDPWTHRLTTPKIDATKTIQTTQWYYTEPNTLVFDLEGCGIPSDELIEWVKSSLPVGISGTLTHTNSDHVLLLNLHPPYRDIQANLLHQQTYAILKYRGLRLKNMSIYLKPTLGLSFSSIGRIYFWRLQINAIPVRVFEMDQEHIKAAFGKAVTKAFSRCHPQNVLIVLTEHVHTNQETGLVTMLAQEIPVDKHLVNPIRALIYISFLQHYLPMTATLIQP
ncbi:uncharacterized protein B0P05DRAFT_568714 [Gilbertella persicaria]|uniref:uncharacterized protein n=1 Tax=Gilbertella persicaria TaxID=101096 RepID=UPI00221E558E|nr:uncharacterized protein B0P05DRAFT_568714 [Gilbertella persicaria]KAI8091323.1 hypothetical protein B0P05DRAFT_568714 [Gilbertella persicaria]